MGNMIEDKMWFLTEVKKLSKKKAEKELKEWLKNFKKLPNFENDYEEQ